MNAPLSRRPIIQHLTALFAVALLPLTSATTQDPAPDGLGSAEVIHQEISVNASPAKVYAALTDPVQFTHMTTFSMVKDAPPAVIARSVGGSFSLFGGHITGRHIEMVPGKLLVQAWRAADWPEGVFSIVRFELKAQGAGTLIVFDHTGFPNGQGAHLAAGWHANYWEPLKKHLP
jgi:uncharacterized protein YndB with AHSA1/START domain